MSTEDVHLSIFTAILFFLFIYCFIIFFISPHTPFVVFPFAEPFNNFEIIFYFFSFFSMSPFFSVETFVAF